MSEFDSGFREGTGTGVGMANVCMLSSLLRDINPGEKSGKQIWVNATA